MQLVTKYVEVVVVVVPHVWTSFRLLKVIPGGTNIRTTPTPTPYFLACWQSHYEDESRISACPGEGWVALFHAPAASGGPSIIWYPKGVQMRGTTTLQYIDHILCNNNNPYSELSNGVQTRGTFSTFHEYIHIVIYVSPFDSFINCFLNNCLSITYTVAPIRIWFLCSHVGYC